jgi:hypothetical protein
MKIYTKLIITILAIIIGYFVCANAGLLPSIKGLFKEKEIQLKETVLILEDVKSIAQFFTATAYEDIAIDTTKQISKSTIMSVFSKSKTEPSRFVILAKGKCMAGKDLSNIKTEDIVVKDSCVSITIPKTKILTTIVNPSDFEIYIDDGNWSNEEVKGIKVTALKPIELLAISDELLKKASERTKLLLTQFFKSIGFKQVTVIEIG